MREAFNEIYFNMIPKLKPYRHGEGIFVHSVSRIANATSCLTDKFLIITTTPLIDRHSDTKISEVSDYQNCAQSSTKPR